MEPLHSTARDGGGGRQRSEARKGGRERESGGDGGGGGQRQGRGPSLSPGLRSRPPPSPPPLPSAHRPLSTAAISSPLAHRLRCAPSTSAQQYPASLSIRPPPTAHLRWWRGSAATSQQRPVTAGPVSVSKPRCCRCGAGPTRSPGCCAVSHRFSVVVAVLACRSRNVACLELRLCTALCILRRQADRP